MFFGARSATIFSKRGSPRADPSLGLISVRHRKLCRGFVFQEFFPIQQGLNPFRPSGINECKVSDRPRTKPCILGQRQQLTSALSFAHRLRFAAEGGVDPANQTPGRRDVRLITNRFSQEHARRGIGCTRRLGIVESLSSEADKPFARTNKVSPTSSPSGGIAASQCTAAESWSWIAHQKSCSEIPSPAADVRPR